MSESFDPKALRDLRERLDVDLAALEADTGEVERFVNGRHTLLVDLGPVVVEVRALPASAVGDWFRKSFDSWIGHPGSAGVVSEASAAVGRRHVEAEARSQLAREVIADAIGFTLEAATPPHVPASEDLRQAERAEFLSRLQDGRRRVR